MAGARVGLAMRPEWLGDEGVLGFVEALSGAGLEALEFDLDPADPAWPRTRPLMDLCSRLGLAISLHAPFRGEYGIAGFAGERRAEIERTFAPLLADAARYAPALLVVHAAEWVHTAGTAARPREALEEDTLAFVRWLLARDDGLEPVLENLDLREATTRVVTTRADVRRLVERVADQRVGICWDLGHDAMTGSTAAPEPAWLALVRHVHLHDIDEQGHDHCPLMYGRVPSEEWLEPLLAAGYRGTVTLEFSHEQLAHLPHDRLMAVLTGSVRLAAELVGKGEAEGGCDCGH